MKVRGGTTRGDQSSLCKSCSSSHIIRGEKLDDEITYCFHYGERVRVPFKVLECNVWDDKSKASVHDMAKIAWIVNSDRKAGRAGFLSPIERKKAGLKIGDLKHGDTTYHTGDED